MFKMNGDDLYTYKAHVISVIDGDTLDLDVDLGFNTHLRERFRLMGINAPEIRGAERERGLEAKLFVEALLPLGKEVLVHTFKDRKEKYGRWLANIYLEDGRELCFMLLDAGLAVKASY